MGYELSGEIALKNNHYYYALNAERYASFVIDVWLFLYVILSYTYTVQYVWSSDKENV